MSDPVAVVVPCHDAAAYLEDALRSVLNQTRPVAELVVVDDGSTDGSSQIAERLGVRCLRQECRGPAAARNTGIRATRAPLVAFLDADDVFLPDKLERQVALLRGSPAVGACGDAWLLRNGVRGARKNHGRAVPSMLTFELLLVSSPVICSSVVVRREALVEAGLFDEDPALVATEDYDLWLRLARGGEICYLDAPLLEYRVVDGSLSDDERFVRGVDRIMDKCLDWAGEEPGVAVRVAQRRAGVRVDAAYHLMRCGRGRAARTRLAEARQLVGWSWPQAKTWLRSWLEKSAEA